MPPSLRLSTPRGPLSSLLLLSPLLLLPLYAVRYHYTLSKPLNEPFSVLNGAPQISETAILGYARYLSEDIGFRTVGTEEHMLADRWMMEQAETIRKLCNNAINDVNSGSNPEKRTLECEVWRQEGSGAHR
jgi:hypothetical protein